MNPFDLIINEHPIKSALTPLEFYKELNAPIDVNPTSKPTVGFSNNINFSNNRKTNNLQELFDNNKTETGFWTEQTNTDRYNKPNYTYEPRANMEKVYSNLQSSGEALNAQLKRAWDMGSSFYMDSYIGSGRAIKNAMKGKWDSLSSFNQLEQIKENLQQDMRERTDPIYRSGEEAWYSSKGFLGDLIPSFIGLTGAAVATGVQDMVVGSAMRKGVAAGISSGPIGWALLGAGASGLGFMFSDKAEEVFGENTANYLAGAIAGGGISGLLMKAFTSVKVGSQATKEASSIINSFKKSKNFKMALDDVITTNLSQLKSNLKNITLSNTINRLPTLGVSFAKNYMYAGAESGMEAMTAQVDYLKDYYAEKEKKGEYISDDDKLKLQADVVSMGKDVYHLNKVINTLFNVSMMGDIISGASFKSNVGNLGILYKDGLFKASKYGLTKDILKESLKTTLEEGSQEWLQLVISEGSKNALKKKAQQDYSHSYLETAKDLLTSKEGILEFLGGAISGVGIHQSSSIFRGLQERAKGGEFMTGYSGVNNSYRNQIINSLNNQKDKIDKITKSAKTDNSNSDLDEAIWDMFYYATKADQHGLFKSFIEDSFNKDDNVRQMFDKSTPEETKSNIETIKNEILTKADRIKKSYNNFIEYFSNPYTTGLIDKKDKDVKEKARIFDDLVSESARLLYTQENKIEEALKFRQSLEQNLANTPIYQFFKDNSIFDFNSDGVTAFKQSLKDERFIIDSLGEKDKVRLARLNLLEKSVEDFENNQESKLPGYEKFYNPMLDYLIHLHNITDSHILTHDYYQNKQTKKGNPNLIAQKLGIPVSEFKQARELVFNNEAIPVNVSGIDLLSSLHNLKRVNTILTVVSTDLKQFTNKDTQKAYIDYIYQLRQDVKKEIQEDIRNINSVEDADVREKLVGVDSDSQKLYQALDSLGIINIMDISCD